MKKTLMTIAALLVAAGMVMVSCQKPAPKDDNALVDDNTPGDNTGDNTGDNGDNTGDNGSNTGDEGNQPSDFIDNSPTPTDTWHEITSNPALLGGLAALILFIIALIVFLLKKKGSNNNK